MQNLSRRQAEYLGIKGNDGGVLVVEVEDSSPADKGGLKRYDVIIELNGKKTRSADELSRAVKDVQPGRTIKVKVVREGKSLTKSVKLSGTTSRNQSPHKIQLKGQGRL